MKKIVCWFLLLCLAGLLLTGFDHRLTLREYRIAHARIPAGFDGYRIAVVSDLHAASFGTHQQDLIDLLHASACDLLCLLGDLVSHDTTDFSPVWDLIDGMAGIPMVYVSGNNELSLADYDLFLAGLTSRGVTVLDDLTQTTLPLTRNGDSILLHGYSFTDARRLGDRLPVAPSGCCNILLYHDPACFPEAALKDYDLMLSGHLHGGVIRLPLVGSPLERLGMEPFTLGMYTSRAATMVVTAGLGAKDVLPRFFNPPEVALITLKAKTE